MLDYYQLEQDIKRELQRGVIRADFKDYICLLLSSAPLPYFQLFFVHSSIVSFVVGLCQQHN
jgi:hypothetical protein